MSMESISLQSAHNVLGWPSPEDIRDPKGVGATVFAELVRAKIGRALARFDDAASATVGVLMPDPNSDRTEPPIAIVVEFVSPASDQTLRELQRLSWNFSHVPTLITLEPELLRVWSCCEVPDSHRSLDDFVVHQEGAGALDLLPPASAQDTAARALHWINLVSGSFFSERAGRFDRDGRADQMLLGNLRDIRSRLAEAGLLDDDVCHDLLARTIFVQFLFDRKDSDGVAALNKAELHKLHQDSVLSQQHDDFSSVLSHYPDTYRLFDWLNVRFNGDLFPGKGDTATAREQGWRKEKRIVTKQHLQILSDFIRGTLDMPSGQACLWPQYSFDVIPLEFISSIYETFVTERAARDGIFYTPPHLVDFVLDRVLPWDGMQWDLRILDPACGSGIFLVKAFQRLVHRWKRANPEKCIRTDVLKRLLERNLFGVDKDPHAVRVACFSLYLAMCDEIEPRHYWAQIVFPAMRGQRLVCSDFFAEGYEGFDTLENAATYDLVIGNAPWGDNVVTDAASQWTKEKSTGWVIANKDIGGLFLAKSAQLVKSNGRIGMVQSANSLLFNASGRACQFRSALFSSHCVEEIYNLSALRFKVFSGKAHTTKTSVAPACVVIMRNSAPTLDTMISYVTPKELKPLVDEFTIVIEPMDRKKVSVRDAINDLTIWKTLMWGGHRDRTLLHRLQRFPSLSDFKSDRRAETREGIIFGDRKKHAPELATRRLFASATFPAGETLTLSADELPLAGDIWIDGRASTDFSAFTWPQLLIKQSWQKATGRFSARLVTSTKDEAVLCNQSFVTVHAALPLLEAACLTYNSLVAVYVLQLVSGRIAAYRPEAQVGDLVRIPLPVLRDDPALGFAGSDDLDQRVFNAFGLKDAEQVLVEDMIDVTLADFRGDSYSAGRRSTVSHEDHDDDSHLRAYSTYFMRVLKAGFGLDRPVTITIYQQEAGCKLPYRLVGIELGGLGDIRIERIKSERLLRELERLDHLHQTGGQRRGIYHEKVARIYDSTNNNPTIYILKPDRARYWTRSVGMYDADEVAADLFQWLQHAKQGNTVK